MKHINLKENALGRIEVTPEKGFVFYDKDNYKDLTDEDGKPREVTPAEISYFKYGVYAPDTDFESRIVAAAESEVPKEQIF